MIWLVTKCLYLIFDRKLTDGKILFEVVLKEMMFFNKNVEGMFKGKCFNDVMEVVRSRIRYYGGS